MRRLGAAFLLLSIALAPCAAQERRKVLVGLEAPGMTAGRAEAYAASLDAALARSNRFGAARRASPGLEPEALSDEAARLGYDLAIRAKVERVEAGIRLSWIIVGLVAGEELDRGSIEAPEPDERDLAEFFWLELVAAAEKAAAVVKSGGRATLTILGPPGAIVEGLNKERVELPDSGELAIELKAPATYIWKARASGYASEEGIVSLFSEGVTLELDLEKVKAWTIELGMRNAAFPDFWASYRLLGDRLFVKAGFEQYLAGFALGRESSEGAPPFFVSIRLIEPGIGAGWLFGKSGGDARPYAGLTITTRLAFPKDAGFFIDPVAPLALTGVLGIEWKPLDRFGFFLELGPTAYPFADGYLMASAARDDNGGDPLIAYSEDFFLEFPAFRFGARMHL